MISCDICCENTSKISIALCKKILGPDTKRTLCLKCLSDYLDVSQEDLLEMAEDFKKQGCKLFE